MLVNDIRPGGAGSNPSNLTNVGGTLYFSADDGTSGYELWLTDGTSAGTTLVKDNYPGIAASNPNNLTNLNGTLYLTATERVNGEELWRTTTSNQAPVLAPIGNQNGDELVLLTYIANATDPDLPPNTLTFSLDPGAPAGAVID